MFHTLHDNKTTLVTTEINAHNNRQCNTNIIDNHTTKSNVTITSENTIVGKGQKISTKIKLKQCNNSIINERTNRQCNY